MKRSIQKFIRKLGYNVRVHTPVSDVFENLLWQARHRNVQTILDIGANVGQFATRCLESGWDRKLVSFECLEEAHASIVASSATHANWSIAPRAAIGSSVGTAMLNMAENSQASSLLADTETLHRVTPSAQYVAQQEVAVETLDNLLPRLNLAKPYLLKMDVQGFESEVLKGAAQSLKDTAIIYTEMSLFPLYEGEADFTILGRQIIEAGFRCIAIYPGYSEGTTREIAQADAIFVRA